MKTFESAKSPWRFVAAAVAGLSTAALLSFSAVAQQSARGGMAACRVDVATFCKGIEAGGGKRIQCLAANSDKLSPECASVVSARAEARAGKQAAKRNGPVLAQTAPLSGQISPSQSPPAPVTSAPDAPVTNQPPVRPAASGRKGANRPIAACAADMKTLCGTVASGGGAVIKCLRDNQAKVSPECRSALASVQQAKAEARGACRADAQRLCSSSKGPERRACLAQNQAQLTPECVTALAKRPAAAQPKIQ